MRVHQRQSWSALSITALTNSYVACNVIYCSIISDLAENKLRFYTFYFNFVTFIIIDKILIHFDEKEQHGLLISFKLDGDQYIDNQKIYLELNYQEGTRSIKLQWNIMEPSSTLEICSEPLLPDLGPHGCQLLDNNRTSLSIPLHTSGYEYVIRWVIVGVMTTNSSIYVPCKLNRDKNIFLTIKWNWLKHQKVQ